MGIWYQTPREWNIQPDTSTADLMDSNHDIWYHYVGLCASLSHNVDPNGYPTTSHE